MKRSLILILLLGLCQTGMADPPQLSVTIQTPNHDSKGRIILHIPLPGSTEKRDSAHEFALVVKNVSSGPFSRELYDHDFNFQTSFFVESDSGQFFTITSPNLDEWDARSKENWTLKPGESRAIAFNFDDWREHGPYPEISIGHKSYSSKDWYEYVWYSWLFPSQRPCNLPTERTLSRERPFHIRVSFFGFESDWVDAIPDRPATDYSAILFVLAPVLLLFLLVNRLVLARVNCRGARVCG